MNAATILAAAAGTAAVAAYTDAKLHISKDVGALAYVRRMGKETEKAVKEGRACMWYPFEATARKWPSHRAIWSRTGIYTYSEVYERACQYGNYFLSIGIKPGDMVAMYILNSPEYMITLLGLWSIGCTASGINYNLASDALVHCIKICGAKYLIADSEEQLRARVQGSSDRIENELGTKIVTLTAELKGQLSQFDASRPADSCRAVVNHVNHPTLIIYTSGTTGMPKAFAWRIERMYPIVVRRPSDFQSNGPGGDTWYDPMPLYHGTGGLMAINALMNGCTLAIGRGFSIRNFWKDVRDSEATIFVYVGETARYLLSAPPSPDDKNHTIRMMFGNGMRPDVWEKFQERFGVPEVCEFFNSTEGMFAQTMYSKSGFGRGSVGHQGWLMRKLLHKTQVPVRIDHETGDIYRDPETGFAVREDYNVGGEILINLPSREAWQGYYEAEEASNKKIIRDVFTKGDMYFRPGDALRRDDEGLWYFMDRLGDTYRWKGENVSTAEVGEVLGRFNGIAEANVYGVTLPNHDGRAGCAAVSLGPLDAASFDWAALAAHSRSKLPRYAVPVFVRVTTGEAGAMGSHNNKQDKVKLRAEGVDPALKGSKVVDGHSDAILWLHPKAATYVPFTEKDWEALKLGSLRI